MDLQSFQKTAAEALALARARLADAELRLRAADPTAPRCADPGRSQVLAEADALRLKTLERLWADGKVSASLARRALGDPLEAVRQLAQAHRPPEVVQPTTP